MMSDPTTLYKLMSLYMLKQVNFPLTNNQLSDFFLQREYTTYFTLQQVLNELLESGLITVETIRNASRYRITKEGEDTILFFGKNISQSIVTDMNDYLKTNKFKFRDEVGVVSDFYKNSINDYTVHCSIVEGKTTLFEINLSVPTKDQASAMCDKWADNNQSIYEYVMKKLL